MPRYENCWSVADSDVTKTKNEKNNIDFNSINNLMQGNKEKIENAPDGNYEIGVLIGTYLPFVLLVILAYIIYYRMKNRKDL